MYVVYAVCHDIEHADGDEARGRAALVPECFKSVRCRKAECFVLMRLRLTSSQSRAETVKASEAQCV